MNPILIGLHGVKRAGKNTTANFFREFAEGSDPALAVVERGFADKAKWSFARQFYPKISMQDAIKWVDRFKEEERACFVSPPVDWSQDSGMSFDGPLPQSVHFRTALAQFATEGARDIYGDDFWVDQLLPEQDERHVEGWCESFMIPPKTPEDDPYSIADLCLITDNRFENEIHRIKACGGYTVKVKRKAAELAVIEEARRQGREVHRSELGLSDELFDFVINNDDNDLNLARSRTLEVWDEILLRREL